MIFQRGSRQVRGSWAFKAGNSVSCAGSKSLTHTTYTACLWCLRSCQLKVITDLGGRPALDSCPISLLDPITTALATSLASSQKPWGWRQTSSQYSGRMLSQNMPRLCAFMVSCLLETHLSSYGKPCAVLPSNLWGLRVVSACPWASMDTGSLADPPDRHTGHALPHPGDGPLRPGGP